MQQQGVLKAQRELALQRGVGGDTSPVLKRGGGGSGGDVRAATASAAVNDTLVALEERGKHLQATAEKSEQLNEAASDYNKMAKKLLRDQQSRTAWMGGGGGGGGSSGSAGNSQY